MLRAEVMIPSAKMMLSISLVLRLILNFQSRSSGINAVIMSITQARTTNGVHQSSAFIMLPAVVFLSLSHRVELH